MGTMVKGNSLKTTNTKHPGSLGQYEMPNLWRIGIEEGEATQLNGPENIFNKIIEEKFPKPPKHTYKRTRDIQDTK